MQEFLLKVNDLEVVFDAGGRVVKAVDGVSFMVRPGEITGIVGESGSGKSVTSLSVMQLIPHPGKMVRGTIQFAGGGQAVNLASLPEKRMQHYRGNEIAMIFQEPMTSLNPVYTCGAQVAEAIRRHKKVSAKAALEATVELFRKVRLPDPEGMLRRYPHQLSGGQKQRVMIAMAMSCRPQLLIADEPTTALDVTVQQSILEMIRGWQEAEKMSVLFITHDLGVVSAVADRVLVMYKGKIVEQGKVRDIFSHPQHPYTRGLLACRPPLDKQLRRLPVIGDFMEEINGRLVEKPVSASSLLESLVVKDAPAAPAPAATPLVSVRELTVSFPGGKNWLGRPASWVKAVDRVSLEVYRGEMLGLVGGSGSGKTTLGRAVLQLLKPSGGQVLYKGEDLAACRPPEMRALRREMQMIFQDPYSSLNPRMTVGAAILEPLNAHRLLADHRRRKEAVEAMLEKVGLQPELYHRYPHEFSGGQRQRICIARALILQPAFIVCDESVAALDVSVQAQVLNLLLQLRQEYGFTCIFISHDLAVVKFMCDRIAVMNRGKMEEINTADNICRHPRSNYTRQLIGAIPSLKTD